MRYELKTEYKDGKFLIDVVINRTDFINALKYRTKDDIKNEILNSIINLLEEREVLNND